MRERLLSHPTNPADLVSYQPGAIVSKEIIKCDHGMVIVFAFDQGQELSEHTVPHEAFVTALEGKAEMRVSGEPAFLEAGQGMIFPANEPHAVKAVERFKMLLVMLAQ